jgi:hypothetical protein
MSALGRISAFSLSLMSGLLASGGASASHQNWTLADQGAACGSYSGDGVIRRAGTFIQSSSAQGGWVTCPVNLSGQFNGHAIDNPSDQRIFIHATVPTNGAEIDVMDRSTTDSVSCYAYGTSENGSMYYSANKSTTNSFTGVQTLTMGTPDGWAGTLGAGTSNVAMRSFVYTCWLPANFSYVMAYRTSVCMNNTQCAFQ